MYRKEYSGPVGASRAKRKKPVLACRFYRTNAGNEPVRDWLKTLERRIRHEVGSDVEVVQWRRPAVSKPLVDGFGKGLWEVRTEVDRNIYRVLFCLDGDTVILLHGFMKKSRKTSKGDLELARKRQRGGE
jgi:phage-related protein